MTKQNKNFLGPEIVTFLLSIIIECIGVFRQDYILTIIGGLSAMNSLSIMDTIKS